MTGRGNVQSITFNVLSDSSGAGSESKVVKGMLRMVTIEYPGLPLAGTDVSVIVTNKGGPGAGQDVTYAIVANNASSVTRFPFDHTSNAAGTASVLVYWAAYPIDGLVTVSQAQNRSAQTVTVTLFVE